MSDYEIELYRILGEMLREPSQSISVKKAWIEKAKEQSLAMRKEDYAVAVSFGDGKDYYLIEDSLMEDLYKSREALRDVIDQLGGLDTKHNSKMLADIANIIKDDLD